MARIVIYDSGVGALSIYREVKAQLSAHEFICVSDNLAFPYGTKSESVLSERVMAVMHAIVDRYDPDLAVVACNTASTMVLPRLRANLMLDIVGVVPAIKPAAKLSKSKHIAVLATPGTIARDYTDNLVNDFASDCRVIRVGSSILVELAERKLRCESISSELLESELRPILDQKECDVLVLACTHFPLLNNEIKDIFKGNNHPISLIDSATGIAKQVTRLLAEKALNEAENWQQSKDQLVFTKAIDAQEEFTLGLEKIGITDLTPAKQTLSIRA